MTQPYQPYKFNHSGQKKDLVFHISLRIEKLHLK